MAKEFAEGVHPPLSLRDISPTRGEIGKARSPLAPNKYRIC